MSTLEADVSSGLTAQGLEVEQERGGLVVRAEAGGSPTSVWINEAERIVRAERVIAYPVDDYSEPLGQALDWLNANRAGVSYSFQEAQRAVVGRASWSSPNRSPAPSQLHLLIALLDRAKGRDGAALARVAEGEGDWDEVVVGEDVREEGGAPPGGTGERADPLTLRFTTSRFDPDELMSEPATQPISQPSGWVEPPTRAIQEIASESTLEAETQNFSAEEAESERGGSYSTEVLERRLESGAQPPGTSRLAFQLAVQQLDNDEGHEKQDLTAARRSPIRRLLRVVLLLVITIPLLLVLFQRVVAPFIPPSERFWERWGEEVFAPEPTALELRRQIPFGTELLRLELNEPLEGHEARIAGSLRALGDKARTALEDFMIVSESSDARKRAYTLWTAEIEPGAEPHLALLKRLSIARRVRTDISRYLRESIVRSQPSDAQLIAALDWSRGGPSWAFVVDLLGRAGEGAEERAAALTKELPHDGDDCTVLRALIRTGNGSPDSVSILLQKRGADWCSGREGRELLTSLIRKEPNAADGLLEREDRILALLGVNLLREGGTPETVSKLVKVAYSRKTPVWVRERAVEALSGRDPETIQRATWPLVYVLNDSEASASLQAEVRRTLKTYGAAGVEALEPYTVRDRSSTRRYALIGLGAMENTTATERIVTRLSEEADARLRLLAVDTLAVLAQEQSQRSLLYAEALVVLRRLSLQDPDPQVRRSAEGLYRSLTKR